MRGLVFFCLIVFFCNPYSLFAIFFEILTLRCFFFNRWVQYHFAQQVSPFVESLVLFFLLLKPGACYFDQFLEVILAYVEDQ